MSHPNSEENILSLDKNPFDGLIIQNDNILYALEGRYACPKCGKSRKFYCYSCYVPIPELKNVLPKVTLPVKIDIIKHKQEIDGKSTSAHAVLIAPDDVRVYTYPDIPEYEEDQTVLIYPTCKALEISQLFSHNGNISDIKSEIKIDLPKGYNAGTLLKQVSTTKNYCNYKGANSLPIKRAVFIDSTWNQSKGIYKDERIRKLPCVVLQNRISQFWRHQKGSPRWYLATIEAIHQFVLEIHLNAWGVHPDYKGLAKCFNEKSIIHFEELIVNNEDAYNGQYDNLLFFFKHMYYLIHTYYEHDSLYAYKRRLN
nr:DTW domain-containing protein 1 isoform X1 [Onthophagus taurus]